MPPLVELVGGPLDGRIETISDDKMFGRLEFWELDERPVTPTQRLLRGERVPASDFEAEGIIHTYSRSEPAEMRGDARVYRYVRPAQLT